MKNQNEATQNGGTFGSRGNFLLVMIMILGVFVAILNETLLNVALPKIMNDFGILPSTAQWLTTGYLLVIGVLIPVTAYLIQRFTTRSLFLGAMGLFTAGTFIAAIAPGIEVLLIGRLLQAAGTGLLFPLLTNVVFSIVPIEKKGFSNGDNWNCHYFCSSDWTHSIRNHCRAFQLEGSLLRRSADCIVCYYICIYDAQKRDGDD
ncbi:lincomycin resistance protein LmrB [Peribacillus asahii]|uniref:Lincomycin resistance protein LmrB n=1 Tax=Peribacillus asahii TaxID=228899 RepID=A0A3Q9RNW0_9BACI|nr:lincomycin resistance protein LmrB [Peribacillus asahii]